MADDNLVTWLRAQLDAREARARDAVQETTGRWSCRETDWGGGPVVEDECGAQILPTGGRFNVQYPHIADNDPAFVLADVEAKRQIIEQHPAGRDHPEGAWYCTECGPYWLDGRTFGYPCATLRLLALPFAGRPGWREEWRP